MFARWLFSSGLLSVALAASAADWRSRSVYQVLTDRFALSDGSSPSCDNLNDYCGGTWQGIINKLDYIQDMGFTAVWISPVTEQVMGLTGDGNSYHGYWQDNLYGLNSKFGTSDDLQQLASALHDRDMYLMVDIVVNHFAWEGSHDSVDYSTYNPFNAASYFHEYCAIDYDDPTSEKICWMGSDTVTLPDLDTTDTTVRSMYNDWIGGLVSNYSIDGLRIDTCLEVETDFFTGFRDAAGVYSVCETFNGAVDVCEAYQEVVDGVLNYPLWYPTLDAFKSTSGDMSRAVSGTNDVKNGFSDSTLLGTFLENHDNPRFPSYTDDIALAENAIAFTMLADGIPIIYYGQEQHFSGSSTPANREALWTSGYDTTTDLYQFITLVNTLRNHAASSDAGYVTYKAYPNYSDTTTVATRKGSDGEALIAVFSNKGSSGDAYTQSIPDTGYASGANIVDVVACKTMTAGSDGAVTVSMGSGAVKLLYPEDSLSGSGLCGY